MLIEVNGIHVNVIEDQKLGGVHATKLKAGYVVTVWPFAEENEQADAEKFPFTTKKAAQEFVQKVVAIELG